MRSVSSDENALGIGYPQVPIATRLKRRREVEDDGSAFLFGIPSAEMGGTQSQGVLMGRPRKRHSPDRGSGQVLVGPHGGDGVGFLHQRQVVQDTFESYGHFPPQSPNQIYGASNQAGAASLPGPSSFREEMQSGVQAPRCKKDPCPLDMGHSCYECHTLIMMALQGSS
ncbi:hypothetical protein NMY22_g18449 [Coprinellus aureogranulatus]|nr:hypothetical protein NMY22_g18449 [Coprinellus aureogranulatus]